MVDLGSGLSLDGQWDLTVDDQTGDLNFESGTDEIEKDLALILGRSLSRVKGKFIDEGRAGDIRLHVRKIVLVHEAIDTVDNVDVEMDTIDDELSVDLTATTVTGQTIDNVFTV